MRRIGILALSVCGLLLPSLAGAETGGTPDRRVSVGVEGGQAGTGGFLEVRGEAGAAGFAHRLEGEWAGEDSWLRVSNPPMSYGWRFDRDGFHQEFNEIFGPPAAAAAIGTGGLTAGLDRAGRLANLSWPGPGHYEHVNTLTVSGGAPNRGVPRNAGSFGGVVAPDGTPTWLTPEFGWRKVSQGYAGEETETFVTELENPALGMRVTITDVVDPSEDLLARNFSFRCGQGRCTPPFAYYANMNPTTARVPRGPSVFDGALDNFSDFATVYDPVSSAMLHFRPYQADPASLTMLATSQPGYGSVPPAISGAYGSGVYIAVAGQGPAPAYQAGLEAVGLVRGEAEGTPLLDPYEDFAGDGSLSSSPAAFGKTAGALAGMAPDDDGTYTVYVAAADDSASALGAVARARARGFRAIRRAADRWWESWIGRARLPATKDAVTRAVSKRALMAIRTAMDRSTGAIVAAPTTQTPYRQDWPRDGSFFNYALLMAGYPELAEHHNEFYRRVYRIGGTWDSFYYTDGAEAGFIWPYEVDTQGLALWALWLPYEFSEQLGTPDPGPLARAYPAIRDTAEALMACRDPRNGMQCRVPEDDAQTPETYFAQGAQGAATVHLALRSAHRAAEALGMDPERREEWRARADELRGAALDPANEACGPDTCQRNRGGIYLVWPGEVLPGDARLQPHLDRFAALLDHRSTFQTPYGAGFNYGMEALLALAPFWTDADREARLDGWVRWLTHHVVDPETGHFGERTYFCDGRAPCEPGRRYLPATGYPHVWSGTEMYVAAAFVYGLEGCPKGVARIGEAPCRGPGGP